MSFSGVKVLFTFVLTTATSSSDVDNQLSNPCSGDLGEYCRDAYEGTSLIQSGKTLVGGISDLQSDPFADLIDDFDAAMVKTPIATGDSRLSLPDLISIGDVKYLFQFCLDLATFAVVVGISKCIKQMRGDGTTAQSPGSQPTPGQQPVDFGPLMKAAKSGGETAWRPLLDEIPDVASAEDFCGCTALHVAAHIGSVSMAKELIVRGADANAREAWEESPLHVAAREDAVDVCKLLLQHGAELNSKDASGRTPLLSAGHAGRQGTCAFLLENGGDCGGVADSEIPALVSTLLLCRLIAPTRDSD